MVLPVIVIPLWGKLLALSVAKKITVLLAARYYGFPRIYRKSLHSVRHAWPLDLVPRAITNLSLP